jgi:acetyltransferase-like isoleucine patch superfamily enzyme
VLRNLRRKIRRRLALKLAALLRSVETESNAAALPTFANSPANLVLQSPWRIAHPEDISIGDDVSFGPGCMLNTTRQYPGHFMRGRADVEVREYSPRICIGDRVSATGYLTIGAVGLVTIEDDVLFASHIFISDNMHGISRVDIPYKYQPLERIAAVTIGRGCWVGEHVVILPGVIVGEQSIIGANSVVTESIPPRSIAVGSPARVVRRWSDDDNGWIST